MCLAIVPDNDTQVVNALILRHNILYIKNLQKNITHVLAFIICYTNITHVIRDHYSDVYFEVNFGLRSNDRTPSSSDLSR